MSQDTSRATSAMSSGTEAARSFKPSISAIREQHARVQADRVLDQFAHRSTEGNLFCDGGEGVFLAALTQLPRWPADTQICIVDDDGDDITCYLKGNDQTTVGHTITLVLGDDGLYSSSMSVFRRDETLCRFLFTKVASTTEPGRERLSVDDPDWFAALRQEISNLVKRNRRLLFDALLVDAHISKSTSAGPAPNPFLPFWTRSPHDWSLKMWALHELNPHLPIERLDNLLLSISLTETEEQALVREDRMPAALSRAIEVSRADWEVHRSIDGLLHSRVFEAKTDALARAMATRLLNARLDRQLVIVDQGMTVDRPTGQNDNPVVLTHDGEGNYAASDTQQAGAVASDESTDSFYLAIISQMLPRELGLLGLTSDNDVDGLRTALAKLAIKDNGGWFALDAAAVPAWFRHASLADKAAWEEALQAYSQAMIEAQTPGFLNLAAYGEREQLLTYARQKLLDRLEIDFGYVIDPDQVTVLIPVDNMAVGGGSAGLLTARKGRPDIRRVSLTELALESIVWGNYAFLTRASVVDHRQQPIVGLTAPYVYDLVRELNVAKTYSDFMKARLLTSPEGQWSKERYVEAEQAQMCLDVLEAKMAGDFLEDGKSPAGQEDRGYKWVKAVLDHPVGDGNRPTVERHQIQVGRLRIASKTKPTDAVIVDDMLIIQPVSSYSARPAVIYTPKAPDGIRFCELTSIEDIRPSLNDPEFQEYLIGLVPVMNQPRIRWALVNKWQELKIDVVPDTGNFLEQGYERKVNALIANIDAQTTSTEEANWAAAWFMTRLVGDVALSFTPFQIRLPIAAFRSLYAVSQAVNAGADGDHDTALYILEAVLLLGVGMPGPKGVKARAAKTRLKPVFNTKAALQKFPEGLRLHTDGVFKGVYEASQTGTLRRFYVSDAGQIYPVRYDQNFATWRMIDPRRPDAYYQAPISFQNGVWRRSNVGLLGGMPKSTKAGKPGTSIGAGASGGPKRYTLDTSKLEQDKVFKKADGHIQDKLLKSVQNVKDEFERRGGGKFHGYTPKGETEKVFTLDLTGMPNSTGRGAWRMYLKEKKVQKTVDGETVWVVEEGVLELYKIVDKH